MYVSGEKKSASTKLPSDVQAEIAKERYFKTVRIVILFTLAVLSAYLLDRRPASVSFENALLALGITWLGFLPSVQYLLDRNRPPMPFFPMVGLFYATSFGLPIFATDGEISSRWSLANVNSIALILVLLGVTGMNIAFYVSKSSLWQQVSPLWLPGPFPLGKILTLLWLLLLAHIAFIYLPFIREIPSVGQLLDPIGYVAYGMFYIIASRGKLPSLQTWLLLGVFLPLEIIERFVSGSLAQLMLFFIFIMLVILHESKRIPILLICVFIVFFVSFNSVKIEYRYLTWAGGPFSQATALEKAQLFIALAVKQYQAPDLHSPEVSSFDSATDSVVSRTAHIILFSEVVKDTPARVPYWNGATYLPLLTSYIPRIILPDKPKQTIGNSFGRRYNYLGSNDMTTSLNLPWIVELYANFGSLGVLIGMPLVGLLMAFIDKKLNNPQMNTLEFVIGATVIFRLIYQESNFSLMVGSVLTLSVALYLMFKVWLGVNR